MTTAEKVMFNEIIHQIKSHGVNVISKYLGPTPVITVDRQPAGFVDKAVQVHECVNGLHRTIHVARISGVCVKWRDM